MGRRKPVVVSGSRVQRTDLVLELYGDATASVVVGETLADAWAYARATWSAISEAHDSGEVACVLDVDDRVVVLLSRDVGADVLAHEAVHVAAWVSRTRGLQFSLKNEEGIAYLVQWFVKYATPLLARPGVSVTPAVSSADASAST